MPECSIPYIPERLRRQNRPIIPKFEVGEHLYMRCKLEVIHNPYKGISITELSHNRSGLSTDILCNPDDVLYSIKMEEPFERHSDKEVCTLQIKTLTDDNKYRKSYTENKNGQDYVGIIELLHEPEDCMYPHAVFRVWINDEVITYKNHDVTLKKLHKIRNLLKEELASMIIKRQVNQQEFPAA